MGANVWGDLESFNYQPNKNLNFSIYQVCVKYKKEWLTGKPVGDNKESKMDEQFLDLQMEKSTEGLSESSVQFMLQAVFFVFLIFLGLISVII